MQFHRPVELKLVRWQWMHPIPLKICLFLSPFGKAPDGFSVMCNQVLERWWQSMDGASGGSHPHSLGSGISTDWQCRSGFAARF